MTKYIDAEKLKEDIQANLAAISFNDDYQEGYEACGMSVLKSIDSLQQEQPEVDLEKALNSLDDAYFDLGDIAVKGATYYLTVEDLKDIARHFYELGIKARKEE